MIDKDMFNRYNFCYVIKNTNETLEDILLERDKKLITFRTGIRENFKKISFDIEDIDKLIDGLKMLKNKINE